MRKREPHAYPKVCIPGKINRTSVGQSIALVRPRAFDRAGLVDLDATARVEAEVGAI